jgi:hypothetical protein
MPTVKPLLANYTPGQLMRHMDGGYYQFEKSVLFADDQDELVIYKHYSEFKDRFTPITQEDFNTAISIDRETLQKQIEDTRTARRLARDSK